MQSSAFPEFSEFPIFSIYDTANVSGTISIGILFDQLEQAIEELSNERKEWLLTYKRVSAYAFVLMMLHEDGNKSPLNTKRLDKWLELFYEYEKNVFAKMKENKDERL